MPKMLIKENSPIGHLHSIAAKLDNDFKNLDIKTINDLLWYFPWRYDDLSQIKPISDLSIDETNTIKSTITAIKSYRSWRRKIFITEAKVADDSGALTALWFNQKFVGQILKVGDTIYLSGKIQAKGKGWQMLNPTYEKYKLNPIHSARLVPIYHLSGQITQKQLRFLMDRALKMSINIDDPLPADILNREHYPWLYQALQEIHFPTQKNELEAAVNRLKFQELFYLQCKYQLAKRDYQSQPAIEIKMDKKLLTESIAKLPFSLTADQNTALLEILSNLSQKQPMNRLLEGDVGSGKTIVAILAALQVINSGQQVAMMAPTEILAQQHYTTLQKILPPRYLKCVGLLTQGRQIFAIDKKINLTDFHEKINSGEIKLIIGTHSLIQSKINFKNLGLVIIDEQHRFGVKQRQALKEKNSQDAVPHLLSMTATPIPRTLSLTLYGDLDISLIKTKPSGRQMVKTFIIPEKKRQAAYKFIQEKISLGQQVFVICPTIDKNDTSGLKSVTQEYQKLNEEIFPDLEIRLVHGQLKTEDKEKIMSDFRNKKFPILVATSVIEVGVDIPAATIMLIESAERFGLSQLHQFRGRIGRNALESFCFLFTSDPSQNNIERLKALTKISDGFKLAELDLKLRGAGEIFGTRQTGLMELRIAKLSDVELIKKTQNWAKEIINNKKYLSNQQLQELLQNLKTEMHLE